MVYIKTLLIHRVIRLLAVIVLVLMAATLVKTIGSSSLFLPAMATSSFTTQTAIIESVKSGNWSDPAVWSDGVVPQAGDAVTIHTGDTIVYDVISDAVLGQITIDGILRFSRETNTRLKVGNHVLVRAGGYLNMGTPTDYLPANFRAELTFVLTEAQANSFVGASSPAVTTTTTQDYGAHIHGTESAFDSPDIGLWVFEAGRWDVHGAPLLRTWSKLSGDASVGEQIITVENNVEDWYVGGQVIVTSTRNPLEYYLYEQSREKSREYVEHEVRIIKSLSVLENGMTRIELDSPLAHNHAGTTDLRGEVALTTRNVVISTELLGLNEQAMEDVRSRQFAHTMYMPGANGDLQYGEFYRLGHYGSLGRYPIHYHRMRHTSTGMVARGNAIWDTGFRCINLHLAHGVLIEDNVCYNSSSTAFFVEEDEVPDNAVDYQRGYSQDNVFVHNIAIDTRPKHFNDRLDVKIPGEGFRVASFWPGAETKHEAYLGNIVAGGRDYGYGSGFGFPESGNAINSDGSLPFTFVSNEAHSGSAYGIFSWQNTGVERDMVATQLWRNGIGGIGWGAYVMPAFYFNAQLVANGKVGLEVTSVNTFLQDSLVVGATSDGSLLDQGFASNGYVMPQYPNPGVWLVRNTFKDLATSGVSSLQKSVPNDNIAGDECAVHDFPASPPYDLKQRPAQAAECSAFYITLMGNKFINVARPLFFGEAANPNSWWKVFDYDGDEIDYSNFVLVRADQDQNERQGVITQKLVTPDAVYDAGFDALVVPMASLPVNGIEFTGLLNYRTLEEQNRAKSPDFTFTTHADYPPTVTLEISRNGDSVTMKATASDDKAVTRVEFFVDWMNVSTQTPPGATGAPQNGSNAVYLPSVASGTGTVATAMASGTSDVYEFTVDLSDHPRKYAYLYVRAFDGVRQFGDYEQRAYSNVIEIGPEFWIAEQPVGETPEPKETPGPTEPSTPGEIPVPMETPTPGATPAPGETSTPWIPGGPGGAGDSTSVEVTPGVTTTLQLTDRDFFVTLIIPPGAYPASLGAPDVYTLVYTPKTVPNVALDASAGNFRFAGLNFSLGAYHNNTLLDNVTFATPLILKIVYPVSAVEGLNPTELALFYLNGEGGRWDSDGIQLLSHDAPNRKLTFVFSHLTEFALFGIPVSVEEETPRLFIPALFNK